MRLKCLLLICALLVSPNVQAVEPDEVLSDPALELRARELSKGLRCLVCRNQSIDDSDALLAKDLRVVVRERLVEGDTDEEVLNFVVDRYGEFVLLTPKFSPKNAVLYLGGPLMLLFGVWAALRAMRSPSSSLAAEPTPLSEDEIQKLKKLDD